MTPFKLARLPNFSLLSIRNERLVQGLKLVHQNLLHQGGDCSQHANIVLKARCRFYGLRNTQRGKSGPLRISSKWVEWTQRPGETAVGRAFFT